MIRHEIASRCYKSTRYAARVAMLCVGVAFVPAGCRREAEPTEPTASELVKQRDDFLVFPDNLRAEDETVNDFVTDAMTVCASGDYEAFRLLWSVKQDPLPREEFKRGWQAVESIRIRAVERVQLTSSQTDAETPTAGIHNDAYVVLADVQLNPDHPAGQREPRREVVLLIRRENERWWLARAPKQVRAWVRKQVDVDTADTAASDELTKRD